jgi:hypothetical protein
VTVEATPGAAAPDAERFLRWAGAATDAGRERLTTYQWIAVARAPSP